MYSQSVKESDLHRVELHCHFEGALRPSTVFNIAKRRGHKLPVATPEEFAEFMRRKEPSLLREFLSYFPVLMSFVAGDPDGIVQLAVDFIEDCAKNKIAYIESRYVPQLFAKDSFTARTGCRLCCEDSSWARNGSASRCDRFSLRFELSQNSATKPSAWPKPTPITALSASTWPATTKRTMTASEAVPTQTLSGCSRRPTRPAFTERRTPARTRAQRWSPRRWTRCTLSGSDTATTRWTIRLCTSAYCTTESTWRPARCPAT
ncbi:hypothetical protein BOX15_Mlig024967g2 [Macrostomum lignano]|uniref:adenosine deaminase n=1 Tax=Macrostomum lignano TaxID=282301 RepID=A0A267FSM4_9PLAT|nr:hypothetical protein BOX15_Mlig024967g2 [Macrostomum lignano]